MGMKQTVFLLLAAFILNANELKLMFGLPCEREESKQFLDFRYLTQKAPEFAPGSQFGSQWIYGPQTKLSRPADVLLEHNLWCRDAQLVLPSEFPEVTVRIWIGDWQSGWRRFWRETEIRLTANDKVIYEKELNPKTAYEEWCKLEDYVFSRHDGIWDRLVSPILHEEVFTVKPVDGLVRLNLKNILLTALTISPTPERDREIARQVEQERRRQFAERYPWQPLPDEEMPPLTDAIRQRGYVLFQKYGEDCVHPWTRPAATEITDTIRVFAARDEQEIFRFGILPLRDLPELTVEIGDFESRNGKLVTAEHADLWRERYKEQGSRGTMGKITSMRMLDPFSYVLQSMKPQFGEVGTPRMFCLDFRVPLEAAPGDYFAPVKILSGAKVIGTAQLQLKVLPFALCYKDAATYNFSAWYCHWADWWGDYQKNKEGLRETIRKQILFPFKYRFNSNELNPWPYGMPFVFRLGNITGNPGERTFTQTPEQIANFDWWIEHFKKDPECRFILLMARPFFMNCGWNNKFFESRSPEERKNCELDLKDTERITRQVDQMCKERNYPEIYWYYEGEIDNCGIEHVKFALRNAEIVNRIGATSFVTINGPLAYKMAPPAFKHVWANPATPIDEELIATIKKHGNKFGSHNSGDSRFQAGFWLWRTGAEGKYQETTFCYADYMLPYCLLPWNYNTSLSYPDPETQGQRPSLQLLNYRDGRDDYLYCHTLEQAMKRSSPETKEYQMAKQFLSDLAARIHVDQRKYHLTKFDGIEATAVVSTDEWNGFSFERYRWKIATLIMGLEGKK
ncbi:MAG: hypothetical protein GX902_03715 [Lentisphaerae bacterium]|nr:hypothetical protein [Lentisphaerota bacterium]